MTDNVKKLVTAFLNRNTNFIETDSGFNTIIKKVGPNFAKAFFNFSIFHAALTTRKVLQILK